MAIIVIRLTPKAPRKAGGEEGFWHQFYLGMSQGAFVGFGQ